MTGTEIPVSGKRPGILTFLPAALTFLSLAVLVALAFATRGKGGQALSAGSWGVVLLLAFAGWGSGLSYLVSRRTAVPLGLRVAWGMAILIFLGGVFNLIRLFSPGVVYVLGIGGALLFVADLALRRGAASEAWKRAFGGAGRHWLFTLALAVVLGVGLIEVVGWLHVHRANPNDDWIAYFAFPKEMLEAGTLIQPFSLRRLGAYGGQSLLHALLLPFSSFDGLFFVDGGLCLIVVAGLLLDELEGAAASARALILLLIGVLVTLPGIRINTASLMSGTVFFLALYQTLHWLDETEIRGFRAALLLSLVAVAACTLRQNYLVPAVGALGLSYLFLLARGGRSRSLRDRRPELVEIGWALLFGIVILAPWAILAQISSGTFLYPLLKGNQTPGYPFNVASSVLDKLILLWKSALYNQPIESLPFFLLAAALVGDPGARRPLRSTFLAAGVGFAAMVLAFTLVDPPTLSRYYSAFVIATVLAVGVAAARRQSEDDQPRVWQGAALVVLIACVLQIHGVRSKLEKSHEAFLEAIGQAPGVKAKGAKAKALYAKLQAAVPRGAPLLVMLDQPYQLDYGRNRILDLDQAGAVSPPPGMPVLKGPERIAAYLHKLGIRYVAYVEASRARELYRRDVWRRHLRDREQIWRLQAPYYLALINAMAQYGRTHRRLFDEGGMVVVDLQAPAAHKNRPAPRGPR